MWRTGLAGGHCPRVLGHSRELDVPRDTLMAKSLFAVDELRVGGGMYTGPAQQEYGRLAGQIGAQKVKDKASPGA